MEKDLDLVSFENTYGDTDENGNDFITIDGYPRDENEEGSVVVTVFLTPHDDFVIDFHHNGYRMNLDVLELIEDSKRQLLENRQEQNAQQKTNISIQMPNRENTNNALRLLRENHIPYSLQPYRIDTDKAGIELLKQENISFTVCKGEL